MAVVTAKLVLVVEAPLACGTGEPDFMLMGSLDVPVHVGVVRVCLGASFVRAGVAA